MINIDLKKINKVNFEMMTERRDAIFVNKRQKIYPLSRVCQICNIIDGLFQCNICNKNLCVNHKKTINNNSYCILCINDPKLTSYINIIYINEQKQTCYTRFKEKLKLIFSFEWIKKSY